MDSNHTYVCGLSTTRREDVMSACHVSLSLQNFAICPLLNRKGTLSQVISYWWRTGFVTFGIDVYPYFVCSTMKCINKDPTEKFLIKDRITTLLVKIIAGNSWKILLIANYDLKFINLLKITRKILVIPTNWISEDAYTELLQNRTLSGS